MKVRINRFNWRKKEYNFFHLEKNNPLFAVLSTEKKLTHDQKIGKSYVTQVTA